MGRTCLWAQCLTEGKKSKHIILYYKNFISTELWTDDPVLKSNNFTS